MRRSPSGKGAQGPAYSAGHGRARSKSKRGTEPLSEPGWRTPRPVTREAARKNEIAIGVVQSDRPLSARAPRRLLPVVHLMWRHVAFALVLGMTVAGVGVLLTDPLFVVTDANTEVRGTRRLTRDQIVLVAGIVDESVFKLRPAPVTARIMKLDGVAAAAVHVWLPAQVVIDVEEYRPLVQWQLPEGTKWIAEDGATISTSGDAPPLTLVDQDGGARDDGGSLRGKVLSNLIALHRARPGLADVYYGGTEGLYFRASQGWTVYLGEEGEMSSKMSVLDGVERKLTENNLHPTLIDLRDPDVPTFR